MRIICFLLGPMYGKLYNMINSPLNGKAVLVVDDEAQLREAIIFDFDRRSCQIFQAANGKEAIEIIKSNKIDIVISDIRMPNGDGVFLLREIRKIHPTSPIVLLATGFADFTESQALSMGACGLLEKPIDRKKMLSVLENSAQAI